MNTVNRNFPVLFKIADIGSNGFIKGYRCLDDFKNPEKTFNGAKISGDVLSRYVLIEAYSNNHHDRYTYVHYSNDIEELKREFDYFLDLVKSEGAFNSTYLVDMLDLEESKELRFERIVS